MNRAIKIIYSSSLVEPLGLKAKGSLPKAKSIPQIPILGLKDRGFCGED